MLYVLKINEEKRKQIINFQMVNPTGITIFSHLKMSVKVRSKSDNETGSGTVKNLAQI